MPNSAKDRVTEKMRHVSQIDTEAVRGHLDEHVRSKVEETLNRMLDA